jgi:hypothetical protein
MVRRLLTVFAGRGSRVSWLPALDDEEAWQRSPTARLPSREHGSALI